MHRTITLANGVSMPLVGLGTYKTRGQEAIQRVLEAAIKSGYRAFDTASVYRNEAEIGLSLKTLLPKYGLKREEIFITSKLSPKDQGQSSCRNAFLTSLKLLQLEYLDLYLIHWPGVQKLQPTDPNNQLFRHESWAELETLYKEGTIRAIGVSNFNNSHLEDLLKNSSVIPHVNQVEFHPHYRQEELMKYCLDKNIHIQAYSSLGTTVLESPLLCDDTVKAIAQDYGVTPAQVLLCWAIQQNISVLPKSTNPLHIEENIKLDFTLKDKEMDSLSSIETKKKYAWDASIVI